MPRMINLRDAVQILAARGLMTHSLECELMEQKDISIDLVRCMECKWWQNPCYGYGAYGYCSDGERKEDE